MRRWWVQRFCEPEGRSPRGSRSLSKRSGAALLMRLIVLDLLVVIGDALTGLLDEPELEVIEVLFAEIETSRLGLAAPGMATARHRIVPLLR